MPIAASKFDSELKVRQERIPRLAATAEAAYAILEGIVLDISGRVSANISKAVGKKPYEISGEIVIGGEAHQYSINVEAIRFAGWEYNPFDKREHGKLLEAIVDLAASHVVEKSYSAVCDFDATQRLVLEAYFGTNGIMTWADLEEKRDPVAVVLVKSLTDEVSKAKASERVRRIAEKTLRVADALSAGAPNSEPSASPSGPVPALSFAARLGLGRN